LKYFHLFAFTMLCVWMSVFVSAQPIVERELLGRWEYRQTAGTFVDREGEILEFKMNHHDIHGYYFGLEREGEHGVFYTAVEMLDVKLSPSGSIEFLVPGRAMYSKRPTSTKAAALARMKSQGFTRDELRYQGSFQNGRMFLTCSSPSGTCPDEQLIFYKK
jgi:hypothetical protein